MDESSIVGVSLGATRSFKFESRLGHNPTLYTKPIKINVEHGSIVEFKDPTNKNWKHSLPKDPGCKNPRISLTFRTMK